MKRLILSLALIIFTTTSAIANVVNILLKDSGTHFDKNIVDVFLNRISVDKIVKADKINSKGKYILLENVQDPSNLGAAARTAEALGIDGLIVSGGCDIYNPKALRASMGAFFRLSVFECGDVCKFIGDIQKAGMRAAASTPSAKAQDITAADLSGGIVCIVGNEGAGVTPAVRAASDFEVTIPMKGSAESLNASTAAAILMWEMMRRGD